VTAASGSGVDPVGRAGRAAIIDAPGPLQSGEQHEIRRGNQLAVACEVGATLRFYTVGGVDVLDGFPAEEASSVGRGQVLAPWPNRLDGGTYEFEGREGRAALDEPEHGNAIHGLVRWLPWWVVSSGEDFVELGCVLHPQPGYPWRTDLRMEYRLEEAGLTTIARATNRSDRAAPFGLGFHPYLTVGTSIDQGHAARSGPSTIGHRRAGPSDRPGRARRGDAVRFHRPSPDRGDPARQSVYGPRAGRRPACARRTSVGGRRP
jgi:hypothetical protein